MAESPYFPPPRAKPDGGAYREAALRPAADPETQPKRVVVSRPAEPSYAQPKEVMTARDLVTPMADERTYWERHRIFARFPRPIGGVMVLLGGWIAWESVQTLLHGGTYYVRGTLFGPVALLVGIWALLFGYPLERNGRPPTWWIVGQVACLVVGLCIGAGMLALLASAAAY